jgi:hypothetical protein
MSAWLFIVGASALGGAVVLWHAISRSKYANEVMLRQYSQMLAAARAEKAKKLSAAADPKGDNAEPQEVR